MITDSCDHYTCAITTANIVNYMQLFLYIYRVHDIYHIFKVNICKWRIYSGCNVSIFIYIYLYVTEVGGYFVVLYKCLTIIR